MWSSVAARAAVGPLGTVCRPRNRLRRNGVMPAQHVAVHRADSCRVLSYNSVRKLAAQPHVAHLPDRVLEAYAEEVTG
jgi:hypothetical protein